MAAVTAENYEVTHAPTAADRVADAVRHLSHFSHKARLLRSMARDAGEEGVHAAKRAVRQVKRAVEALEDVKEETAHRIRRQPFRAVGIAAGAGLLLGAAVGCIGGRFGHRHARGG
jgi:ElaB/YqjD/DUF883 family membrane-anchored ribosome-binding protein